MTTTTIPVRLDFDSVSPTFARALTHLGNAATAEADRAQIDPRLRELLRLRTSQLNGCAYCVDMHTPRTPWRSVRSPNDSPPCPCGRRAVLALVVTVNARNAVGVSTRAWEPGSYQP